MSWLGVKNIYLLTSSEVELMETLLLGHHELRSQEGMESLLTSSEVELMETVTLDCSR